mgnify:FL=1
MEITLYNFSKRSNSTKQPSNGTIKHVTLKNECSIYNPIFIFSSNNHDFNYIKAFSNKYYYVTDIKHTPQNIIEVSCEMDILATYKYNILDSYAFVLYATKYYNTSLVDTRLSSNKNVIVNSTNASLSFIAKTQKMHIVSYIGNNGASYVALDDSALNRLCNAIQSNEFAELFNNPQNALAKVLTDTSSCITSCLYNPCTVTGAVKEIILAGGYAPGVTGYAVNRDTDMEIDIAIPWNFTDFRQCSKFTTLLIYLPGYGYQSLNADNYCGKNSIHLRANLDSVVGEITYLIDHKVKCSAVLSSNEQISTTTNGRGGILSTASTAIGSITGGIQPSSIFNSVISSLRTDVGSVGSNGGLTSFNAKHNITLYCISHDTNVAPENLTNNYGRPLNEVIYLNSLLGGYVECANASISANTSQENIEKINSYLNGGVYLE